MNCLQIIHTAEQAIKLIMPITPSNNEIKAISRFAYRNYVKAFSFQAASQIGEGTPIKIGNVAIIINRFSPKLLDYDNLVGGCKPLIDGMTDTHKLGCGLIQDDSPKVILYNKYLQTKIKDKGESFTHVIILKLSDETRMLLRNYNDEIVSLISQ